MLNMSLAAILAFLIIPNDAYAYLDPATIGMVFQVVIAAVVGAFIFIRGGFASTKDMVTGFFKKKSAQAPSSTDEN